MNISILGPSLVDLETITSSTTARISTVFMIRGCLSILGSLVGGSLVDRVNVYLLLGAALFANAALYGAVPWCRSLAAVLGVLSPPEFFNAILSVGETVHRVQFFTERL